MTVDRLTVIPVALLAAATSWATASNCCVENGCTDRLRAAVMRRGGRQ
jgi:hypothetical protein